MKKLIVLCALFCAGVAHAQDDSASDQLKDWDNLYDYYGDALDVPADFFQGENNNNKESNEPANNYEEADDDQLFEDQEEKRIDGSDINNDYQIEDNRSAPNEEEKDEISSYVEKVAEDEEASNKQSKSADVFSSKEIPQDDSLNILDKIEDTAEEKIINDAPAVEEFQPKEKDQETDQQVVDSDSNEYSKSAEIAFDTNSELKPIPLPPIGVVDEDLEKIIQETQKILNEDQGNDFADEDDEAKLPEIAPSNEIAEETQRLLDEIDNISGVKEDAVAALEDFGETNKEELDFEDIPDEDTVDKVYQDLNEDLDKLMETWKKLSEDDVGEEKNPDDSFDIADYEEKYDRPFREGLVLSQRDDYYEGIHGDASQNQNENTDNEDIPEKSIEESELKSKSEEDIQNGSDSNASLDDQISKLLADIQRDEELKSINAEAEASKEKNFEEDNDVDKLNDDSIENSVEMPEKPIMYIEDALTPNENDKPQAGEEQNDVKEHKVSTLDVGALNPAQYDQIMNQFKLAHKEEMDVISESLGKHSAPEHKYLSLDEVLEITSPGYPNAYPTNSVVEWFLDGQGVGMGIEMNITDFSINGIMGEYLLVKPGGVDDSGNDGLLFSYRLDEPRRYRFLDVDKMFVKFVTPGLWPTTFRGFKFTVKMVAPLPKMEEMLPEPEPIVPEHEDTHTLYLGLNDINFTEFKNIEEDFRLLLADMATVYINANEIPLGMNTTREVTRINGTRVCHLSWPEAHRCIQVTFAVPLNYGDNDEELPYRLNQTDMQTMWSTYSSQDPFASRLARMQVSEFGSPDDRRVMTSWVIVGFGVLVAVLLLIISLWRYSCFDNYSRMNVYEEEEYEKRGLDLYPTPHQTLPPLHEWADINDTTRVDMGGFTNRSFEDDLRDRDATDA